ncbi:MAG TPA: type II secretion system F family protein [Acidimicrobiales bacterium]|nr:type II secretion system F family protein [Acidimicrobiales bacterium]
MTRLGLVAAGMWWIAGTYVLASTRFLSRARLWRRVGPHVSSAVPMPPRDQFNAGHVLREFAVLAGERMGWILGSADVARRLERVHSAMDVGAFRLRQMGAGVVAVVGAAMALTVAHLPAVLTVAAVPFSALAAYAATEARLNRLCGRWSERRMLELPVIAEQLAMLIGSGWSTGTALARVAERGSGACAIDLSVVVRRIRQGASESQALTEWVERSDLPAVRRVVSVLIMGSHSAEASTLLSGEARALRRDVQRRSIELMERRSQQVWIPVTVAALVPGVILVAIPFAAALRIFAST